MRIVFVRHGYPDYKRDCLTEVGHLHAEAAAVRLAEEPFTRIEIMNDSRHIIPIGHEVYVPPETK